MMITLAVRYTWFNQTLYDNYLSNTLTWMLVTQLLREHSVEQLLSKAALMSVTLAQHLSMATMSFIAAEFMGFVALWSHLSPRAAELTSEAAQQARLRQRYHRLAALFFAGAFLAVTTRTRVSGQVLELAGGWDNVLAWALFAAMPVTLSAQMTTMCIAEFRRDRATRRERLLSVGAAVIAAIVGINCLVALFLAIFEELGWVHSIDYRLKTHPVYFFLVAAGTMLAAATPCVLALIARLGSDHISRNWRQLQRLRSDMTAAVPGTAFELRGQPAGRRKTLLQLHQTTVEIRDAILQLRPYFRAVDQDVREQFLREHSVPKDQHEDAMFALQLAAAVRAKAAGDTGTTEVDAATTARSHSTNLYEETTELLRVSRWWPQAQTTRSSTVS
ncbi:DUF6545 domain-containing protein [Mycobacteroides abscessus]|uniref:DUF6545 domain-containing protein n=1 Tax=Mycobacteroides abscessus TaxID=36809 RepID=UPI00105483A6|nr:DUF6545 domain-containing protein [Mycobacteroides abscessus]